MYQPDNTCVQRWFAELTGFETCNECKGLIVDVGSSTNSEHNLQSPSSPISLPSRTCDTAGLQQNAGEPQQPTHDHTNYTTTITTSCNKCPIREIPAKSSVIPYQKESQCSTSNTRMLTRGLREFYPGFIQPAPGPCRACRRVLGPHPTKCPGCNHKYMLQLAENPPRPKGYIGKRPPFGQAGWRVARGHHHPKPVTLHGYGCYMQRKQNCYGGENTKNFTHLGQPPSVLVNFKGCPGP